MAGSTMWEGKHQALIPTSTAEDVWSIIKHFTNIHTLLPSIQTCQLTSGEEGQPGCVRRCCTGQPLLWAEEKLLSIDHVTRSYTYEVLENNMGIKKYVATMAVGGGEGGGSTLEWGYSAEPVDGWSRELFDGYIEKHVGDVAKKVEEIILQTKQIKASELAKA